MVRPKVEAVPVGISYLAHDEYQLEIKDSIGDKDFYQCVYKDDYFRRI